MPALFVAARTPALAVAVEAVATEAANGALKLVAAVALPFAAAVDTVPCRTANSTDPAGGSAAVIAR